MSFASYPSLHDKVVFITGGATGIGASLVRAFHGQGARVGFVDILDDAGEALAEQCRQAGGSAVFRHCDITDIAALEASIADIAAELGPIGVLVNNAANDNREPIDDITVDTWDACQNVNFRPHFFAARAVQPGMAAMGGGAIVNFSSISWRFGPPHMVHYASAKAAIVGLTRALASAYGKHNIRVNAIEPGAVITQRQRDLWFPTQASVDAVVERQLIQRVLVAEEIARAVLFLASDDARMITKQTLTVDAGLR